MMTRRYRAGTLGVLAGTMAAALALSACSSGPEASDYKEGDQYTLTVWTNYTGEAGLAWFDGVAKEFEGSHKNVTVKAQHIQNEELDGKLQTALNSGDAPDIFLQRGGGKMRDMAKANQILDLTGTAVDSPELHKKLGDAQFEALTVDGKLLAAPQLVQPGGIWYSKDLFSQADITEIPKTVDELAGAIDKLKGAGITPIALGGKDAWPAAHWYYFFALRECSADTLEATNESLDFSDPCYEKAAKDVLDLADRKPFNEGFLNTSAQQGASSSAGLLANHKAAMELMGNWEPGVVKDLTPNKEPLPDLGWFPFPQVSSGQGDAKAIMGGKGGFSCSAGAPKKLCGEFLALMDSEKNQESFYTAFGSIPLHVDAQDVVTNDYDKQMIKALNDATYVSDFLDTNYGQKVGTVLNQSVVELLTGKTDPAGLVKAITEAADRK